MTPCIKGIEAMNQANVAGKETKKAQNSHATAAGGNAFAGSDAEDAMDPG